MKNLRNGQFFGETNETISFDGITITDTEYTHPFVDIHQLLLNVFNQLSDQKRSSEKKPLWVKHIDEILHEHFSEKLNLVELSKTLSIQPMHLSRDFQKYFQCNLGEYLRKLKVERSLPLLNKFETL
ncbi:MAG: hypothetical protein P0Y62_09415 [Candidatus Chryseobacterium colombiense]|nr:hypothetical protein [Chryseobacterium sp.]WEK68093.1 MAG: hypothetical protein P0Y62_09415 [Chryseobacterium sp.]